MPKPWKIPKSQIFNTQISPLQCKSILACENTKMESVNFDKKFHLKHIDRPRRVRRHFWWKVLHTWHGRSIWRSATAVSPSSLSQHDRLHWSYFVLLEHHAVEWSPWQAVKLVWLFHPRTYCLYLEELCLQRTHALPQYSHAKLENHKEAAQSIILMLLAIWHLTGCIISL